MNNHMHGHLHEHIKEHIHDFLKSDLDFRKIRPQILVVIVDRDRAKKVSEIFHDEHVLAHFLSYAEGTAGFDMLDLLGLDSVDKAVIFFVGPRFRVRHLLSALAERLKLVSPGKGIAFTVPLSGISNPIVRMMDADTGEALRQKFEEEVEHVSESAKHDMIVSIINQGYSEEVVTAAKEAGATGGTVMHGRRIGMEDAVTLFNVSLQSEKEIVFILVSRDKRQEIMKAISHACGMTSEAKGLVFSMPVDDIEGLTLKED